MPRSYRFADFTVSPSRRTLPRAGREVPLIPRYFDLLVLLIDRRREAVHRQDILEAVWSDVVVSDGALSQAVRTLRWALGDTAREPLFIRTMSRHGYRFIHPEVVEDEDAVLPGTSPATAVVPAAAAPRGGRDSAPARDGGDPATPGSPAGPRAWPF